jgi:hypothetical protein
MVGTDWFVQASGAVSIVAQNSATNGGFPTDLGAELTAMNSRAVVQSTDATGTISSARLELNGTPGEATLSATVQALVEAPLIQFGSALAARPVPYGDTLLTILTSIMALFDTHVHPALGNAPPPVPMTAANAANMALLPNVAVVMD